MYLFFGARRGSGQGGSSCHWPRPIILGDWAQRSSWFLVERQAVGIGPLIEQVTASLPLRLPAGQSQEKGSKIWRARFILRDGGKSGSLRGSPIYT